MASIAVRVTNERHAVVEQVGDDDLAAALVNRLAVGVECFHHEVIGIHMQPVAVLALGSDQHELAAAIGVEGRRGEGAFDDVALERVKGLGGADDRGRGGDATIVGQQPLGEADQGANITDDDFRPVFVKRGLRFRLRHDRDEQQQWKEDLAHASRKGGVGLKR